ncbi:MAG TPA: hypothetical protein VFT87_05575 [Candidatus Saccharimonadales bacterium]|nr:hypothetical protein [Candidatus Saccharimonadales bacterium]
MSNPQHQLTGSEELQQQIRDLIYDHLKSRYVLEDGEDALKVAVDVMKLVGSWHTKHRLESRIKELEWAMYTIGDLHMERIGSADFDLATSRVESDRQQRHKIIEDRIANLKSQLASMEKTE